MDKVYDIARAPPNSQLGQENMPGRILNIATLDPWRIRGATRRPGGLRSSGRQGRSGGGAVRGGADGKSRAIESSTGNSPIRTKLRIW